MELGAIAAFHGKCPMYGQYGHKAVQCTKHNATASHTSPNQHNSAKGKYNAKFGNLQSIVGQLQSVVANLSSGSEQQFDSAATGSLKMQAGTRGST